MRYTMVLGLLTLASGCGNEGLIGGDPPPPAEPPGNEREGDPPDWQNCFGGWRGFYSNLPVTHPHVAPGPDDEPAPTSVTELDWWDRPSFEKFDPTLDHGNNWWPVDEGLESDPAFFAVRWEAWIRAWSDTTVEILLGSADDAWVVVDGEVIASRTGIQTEFVRERFDVGLDAGQYPIEVFFAHRGAETSGFSFRVVGGDVSICYPDFGTDDAGDEEE